MRSPLLALVAAVAFAGAAHAQVGSLIYEDNFNNLDHWLKVTGNGSWGWGNGELEYYKNENVDIADVPGEPGNKALRIVAKAESGPGIVDQWGNALSYTSGKISSRSFLSVKYGMIETRVQVPNLANGGWPAFWMMGTQTADWPACGEVDLMEMGAEQVFRNLHDSHNGGNGLDNSTVNQMVGANAIWAGTGGTASLANDPSDLSDRPYYNYSPGLANRFLTYRCYWDSTSMRFAVVDNGIEHDLYTSPFVFGADASEFKQPFYFLMNLAVGGAYTDCYVLGDPGSGLPITMPLPATMYVDYVRIYQWNGQGEVTVGPPAPKHDRFGLYTDTTPTTDHLTPTIDANIYVWESTLIPGTIPPYEGSNVLSWKTNNKGWFGAGIMSTQPTNLYDLASGWLKFRIKIPANVTFQIGVTDVWTNQNYVTFPANTTKYGLVRNGQWGQAAIPVSDLRGLLIDLRMLAYEFVVLETNGASCEFAIDDVYYEAATITGVDGPPATHRVAMMLPGSPNPFVGGTQIRFVLPSSAPYDVAVFDAAGHRVTGFHGIGRAGTNAVRWDGRDDDGRAVEPGVYWYRLLGAGEGGAQKVVLLR